LLKLILQSSSPGVPSKNRLRAIEPARLSATDEGRELLAEELLGQGVGRIKALRGAADVIDDRP
jgi:hypothetical protein